MSTRQAVLGLALACALAGCAPADPGSIPDAGSAGELGTGPQAAGGAADFVRAVDGASVAATCGAQGFGLRIEGGALWLSGLSPAEPWAIGLRWAAVGRAGALQAVPMASDEVAVQGARASVHHGEQLEEWFVNAERGVEQGFVLRHAPAAPPAGAGAPAGAGREAAEARSVILELTLTGLQSGARRDDGRGVSLHAAADRELQYTDLRAFDAAGRPLPASIELVGSALRLHVDDRGAVYPLRIDPLVWSTEQKLLADDLPEDAGPLPNHQGELFGWSMSVSGDWVLIGAPAAQAAGPSAGSAYAFEHTAEGWQRRQRFTPTDQLQDGFGRAVSMDGVTALIGASYNPLLPQGLEEAPTRGAAYVFVRGNGSFAEQIKLAEAPVPVALEHQYGWAVTLSGDQAFVAAPGGDFGGVAAGTVYVYQGAGPSWTLEQQLFADYPAAGAAFGFAISASLDRVAVGARLEDDPTLGVNAGAVYVFWRNGATWEPEARLTASDGKPDDKFGAALALRGDELIVGANTADNGNPDPGWDSGSAYVFTRTANGWAERAKLVGGDLQHDSVFGTSVAIDANTAFVGATEDGWGTGAVYEFNDPGTGWQAGPKHLCGDCPNQSMFGDGLAFDGVRLVAGTPIDDRLGTGSGSALVLWHEQFSQGDPCSSADVCASGFCVDGVCCESACWGGVLDDCYACSVDAGSSVDGTCLARSAGAPCDDHQFCTTPDTCSADGVCTAGLSSPCPGPDGDDDCYESCNPDAGACTAYDGDEQPCANGGACRAGQCLLGNGASCGAAAECLSGNCLLGLCCEQADCGPYRCAQTGACREACESAADCLPGVACNSDARCAAAPAPSGEGCDCALGARRSAPASSSLPDLWPGLGLGFVWRRRRRGSGRAQVSSPRSDSRRRTTRVLRSRPARHCRCADTG